MATHVSLSWMRIFKSRAPPLNMLLVWTDGHAEDANATVLSFHLDWAWVDIATAKEFTDVPKSHALVFTTGGQERTIGRKIDYKNWFRVKLKVDRTQWLRWRAEPLDSESVRMNNSGLRHVMMATATTTSNYSSLSFNPHRLTRSAIKKSSRGATESWRWNGGSDFVWNEKSNCPEQILIHQMGFITTILNRHFRNRTTNGCVS